MSKETPGWKKLAIERTNLPAATQDVRVLDELIRLEVDRGPELLQLRDQMLACLMSFVRRGKMSKHESAQAMRGLELAVQVLRTGVADRYRAMASGGDDEVLSEKEDDYQPHADYNDPKRQMS